MILKLTSSTTIAACLADVFFAMCTSTLSFPHVNVLVQCQYTVNFKFTGRVLNRFLNHFV